MSDQDADNPLRKRLREQISQKAEGADGTEQKENMDDDEDMDDDDDDMESMMDMPPEVEEAAQMVAEAADDVDPAQVMEMVSPLFGEDTTDDPQEMAADVDGDVVTEEELEEKLGEFEDSVDEKLEGVVDTLADETRDVIQKADVGGTPTPSATGDANVAEADLWSDGGEN